MPVQTASAFACGVLCKNNANCVGWAFAYSGSSGCAVTNQVRLFWKIILNILHDN